MQIGARYKALGELMEQIFADKQPADAVINAYFRERRYIGSGDRRFISEKIWDILRHRLRLGFEAGGEDIRKMLLLYTAEDNQAEIFAGGQYGLLPLTDAEKLWLQNRGEEPYPPYVEAECPEWLFAKIGDMELLKSLNTTASADFRVNSGTRDAALRQLEAEGLYLSKTPYSPIGIRAEGRINLNNCMAYQDGVIEVQDEASQLVSLLCDVSFEHKTIDYCCGAGGKSLAIAALLHGKGKIAAHDIDPARLEQLYPRMRRLGISNIVPLKTAETGSGYQRFIVDAPCSGSGTWRRSPDAKFRLTTQRLRELCRIQAEILETAYPKVAVGGRVIYITCSILPDENENNIQSFCQKHPDMQLLDIAEIWQRKIGCAYPCANRYMLHLNPLVAGTDGFFAAILQKNAAI